jgi:hypothetical protein
VPSFGFRRRFWPVLLVTRIRSTVGLKSKPKAVPLSVKAPALPIWMAAPVIVFRLYRRLLLPRPYSVCVAGRKSMPRICSPACRPVIETDDIVPGLALSKAEQAVRRRQADQRLGGGGGRQAERERAQEGSERECGHRVLEMVLVGRAGAAPTKERPLVRHLGT